MVLEKSPHPYMDTPEFMAFFLRAFAELTEPLHDYVYRFERLMARVSGHMPMLADARLDWDMWRAWLLFENTVNTSNSYKDEYEYNGRKDSVISLLTGARELLWNYLSYNADAILKDPKRRAWWIARLTDGLEAEGGRPQRRWFLLLLLSAADPQREAMEKVPVPEKFLEGPDATYLGKKIPLRQPHPLDPFLIVSVGVRDNKAPSFSDTVKKIALDNSLSHTVHGINPAALPATMTGTNDKAPWFSDTMAKIPFDNKLFLTGIESDSVIQSASAFGKDDKTPLFSGTLAKNAFDNKPAPAAIGIYIDTRPMIMTMTSTYDTIPAFNDALTKIAFDNSLSLTVLDLDPATQPATAVQTVSLAMTKWPVDQSEVINQESWSPSGYGYEWRVRFYRPVGRRAAYSSVSFPFPAYRTDGVFFFVYNWRLYVWPKTKMDTAVIQMLRTANLIDTAAAADFERRGFAPLKETLVKEKPEK